MSEHENSAIIEGIEFHAKDFSSPVAAKIAASFNQVHKSVGAAQHKLHEFGKEAAMGALGAVGLGMGLHSIYEKAKEANLELLGLEKSVASTHLALTKWGSSVSMVDRVAKSMERGREVAEQLDEMEGRLRIPMEQLGGVYEATAMISETKLKMSMERQLALTEKISAATKLFGTSGEAAAFRITRAVMSNGEVMRPYGDKFATWLKDAIGPVNRKHKMSPDAVMERIEQKMKDLVPAAQEMGKGLSGSMFMIKDFIDDTARDLTKPTFKYIGQMIQEWQDRLTSLGDKNGMKTIHAYAEKILAVFKGLQSATGFIAEHWKAIAAIAVAHKLTGVMGGLGAKWGAAGAAAEHSAAGKLASTVSTMTVTAGVVNVGQGLGAGISAPVAKGINEAMNARLKPTLAETGAKFAGLASKAFVVTEALGALYMGASSLAAYLDSKHDEQLKQSREAANTITATSAFANSVKALKPGGAGAESAAQSLKNAYAAMGLKPGDQMSAEKITSHLKSLGPDVASQVLAKMHYLMPGMVHWNSMTAPGMTQEAGREIATAMNKFMEAFMAQRPEFFKKPGEEGGPTTKGPAVNNFYGGVHITQDFKDQDPQKVFIAFNDGLARQAQHLTQSSVAHGRGM